MGQAVSPAGRRGGALLAVLWLSAALAAIAFALATTVRGEVERTSTAVDGVRSYYLAAGAIERMVLRMFWWAQNPNLTMLYSPVVPVVTLQFPSGEVVVEIVPETAKLNINAAPPEEIFRLLVNLGVDPGRAQQITLGIVGLEVGSSCGAVQRIRPVLFVVEPVFSRAPRVL